MTFKVILKGLIPSETTLLTLTFVSLTFLFGKGFYLREKETTKKGKKRKLLIIDRSRKRSLLSEHVQWGS